MSVFVSAPRGGGWDDDGVCHRGGGEHSGGAVGLVVRWDGQTAVGWPDGGGTGSGQSAVDDFLSEATRAQVRELARAATIGFMKHVTTAVPRCKAWSGHGDAEGHVRSWRWL